jgi:hypothetical protein
MERWKEGQEEDLQDSLIDYGGPNGGAIMIRMIVWSIRRIGTSSFFFLFHVDGSMMASTVLCIQCLMPNAWAAFLGIIGFRL